MKPLFFILGMMALAFFSVAGELPFPIGEELVYSISWNGIPVAYSTLKTEMDSLEGREVLAFRMRTKTCTFFNTFFEVDDLHESLIDPKTLLPIRYTKNIKEGRYRCHEVTTFDFKEKKAHYEHQLNGTKKSYHIDPTTRDLISFMYFLRSEMLAENSVADYRLMADEKIYDLTLHASKIKEISLPNYEEKVPGLKVVPEAAFDGLFVRKGKAIVWISRDPRHLLTFAKVKVPFGRARIRLKTVNGPGNDFWVARKKDDRENDE